MTSLLADKTLTCQINCTKKQDVLRHSHRVQVAQCNHACQHLMYSINQSNFYISPVEPRSVVQQLSQCSTTKSKKQFRNIKGSSGMLVTMGKRPSHRDGTLMFLEDSNWNGWTHGHWEVIPKRRSTRVQSSCTCVGLDPRDWQTIIFVQSQWVRWEWCGKHGEKINKLFFTQGFVGQQIDLEQYLNLTGNQWRERSSATLQLCHQVDQSILNTHEALWGQCQLGSKATQGWDI